MTAVAIQPTFVVGSDLQLEYPSTQVSTKPSSTQNKQSSPHLETWLPLELAPVLIDVAVVIQDIDKVQVVPLSHHEVIGVMGRCDLHGTSTKAHVHQLSITDDGDLAVVHRVDHMLAMEVLVPVRRNHNITCDT